MWFKTKTGFLHVEGTTEIMVGRIKCHGMDGRTKTRLGVYALRYVHAEGPFRLPWTKPFKLNNRRVYLAYFPDNPTGIQGVTECMEKIEAAIRDNETLCDLSQFGSTDDWSSGWTAFVRWSR